MRKKKYWTARRVDSEKIDWKKANELVLVMIEAFNVIGEYFKQQITPELKSADKLVEKPIEEEKAPEKKSEPATVKQVEYLKGLGEKLGKTVPSDPSKQTASTLIEAWKKEVDERK